MKTTVYVLFRRVDGRVLGRAGVGQAIYKYENKNGAGMV